MNETGSAKALAARYDLQKHPENGAFLERHYENDRPGRAASGMIYYYVAPGERTAFHRIDCDEYWCYASGAPLELWLIGPEGAITVQRLGIGPGCEPTVLIRQGILFASRHPGPCGDGTFLSCITVPRFDPAGFELFSEQELLAMYPAAAPFFR